MNAGHTAERVYSSLRARLLERGFRPGQRLDPGSLASELASSSTPVRDALNRLLGEGLVVARASEGFHLPSIDQIGLADLYAWSTDIVKVALRASARGQHFSYAREQWPDTPDGHAQATREMLATLAAASANPEHATALASAQARLTASYQAETDVLPDLEQEMMALAHAVAGANVPLIVRLLDGRLRRRVQFAAEIVRALYRPI